MHRKSGGASCSYNEQTSHLSPRSVPRRTTRFKPHPSFKPESLHSFHRYVCRGGRGDGWDTSTVEGDTEPIHLQSRVVGGTAPKELLVGDPGIETRWHTSRLFSNLNERTFRHEPGTVLGAAALVAGTTVGAGILALPATTQASGFVASSVALAGSWLYSVVTALLMAEVAINTMCEVGRPSGISITSMAERTLGPADVARASEILSATFHIPPAAAASAFVGVFGLACYATSPNMLDNINSVLVGAVVASFLALLGVAGGGVDVALLADSHWEAVPSTLPVLALAFVMQNVVPVIASQLEGDISKVRLAVMSGLTLPFLMFIVWDAAILGSLGNDLLQGGDPVQLLVAKNETAGPLIQTFSLLAIATSFIGFVLGLSDFISDLLGLAPGGRQPIPYALTLLPPLALALSFPGVFFSALSFAGAYGVMFLFGVLPAAMAWSERYAGTTVSRVQVVPGGRASLLVVGGVAVYVIANETAKYLLPQ